VGFGCKDHAFALLYNNCTLLALGLSRPLASHVNSKCKYNYYLHLFIFMLVLAARIALLHYITTRRYYALLALGLNRSIASHVGSKLKCNY
jgi:ABC-type uncharacterized transport system permease subunit